VHFLRSHPPEWLGHKLLAVNLSDVGAMGATPTGFLVTAALPGDTPPGWWESLSRGLGALAREAGVSLLGGDVTRSSGPVMLGVTAWGELGTSGALLRSGGCPGDVLMLHVAEGVGRSALGLARWLEKAGRVWPTDVVLETDLCVRSHLRPPTSWRLGPWAVSHGARAGMDCSDGLFTDVPRLARQSNVGITVELGGLPEDALCSGMTAEERAAGGEDYGLLVFVPPGERETFEEVGFFTLGHATSDRGVTWQLSGTPIDGARPGFRHFARG